MILSRLDVAPPKPSIAKDRKRAGAAKIRNRMPGVAT